MADNLEYKALLQESAVLTGGFRAGIKELCLQFHGKELLASDIYQLSISNANDLTLPGKLVDALLNRVKNDAKAFQIIVDVLHDTTGMEHLAKKLEKKLADLVRSRTGNI